MSNFNNISIVTTEFSHFLTRFDVHMFAIFVFPLLAFSIMFVLGDKWKTQTQYELALCRGGGSFIHSLIFVFRYAFSYQTGFRETMIFNIIPTFTISLRMGIDGLSIFFVVLTNLFIFLCILSLSPATYKLNEALLYLFFLQWGVLGTFLFLDLLGFFLFFERTLIPIYFLVLLWGSRERRVRASYLISIYTLFGSIFRFFNLLYLYSKTGTTDYELLLQIALNEEDQCFLWITFFFAFAAKIPLFPLHIWLPEAHVEAPTIGSVLLAVLMLKLGTYGLIRFSLPLFPVGTVYFGPLVSTFAFRGVIYTCLTAIRQIDLKKIIAYSSVGHMNVVLLGIMAETTEALQGAVFQRLSHGVVSGTLFFCVGVLYERYTVRSLKYYGGLAHFYPLFTIVFLRFSLANISFPLTSSFVGEFYIFVGLFRQNFWATVFAATSMVLGAVYTLWSFNRIFFGNLSVLSINAYTDLTSKEMALFTLPIVFMLFIGILPHFLLDVFYMDCVNILEHARLGRENLILFNSLQNVISTYISY